MQQIKASGGVDLDKGALGKLKGAFNVVTTLSKVGGKEATSHLQREDSEGGANANDPSVILTMITGGKMKQIDDAGLVVEDEDDDPPPGSRRMSSRSDEEIIAHQVSSSSKSDDLLKELRGFSEEMKQAMADYRKETAEALAEMRREIVDLKSQAAFSSA